MPGMGNYNPWLGYGFNNWMPSQASAWGPGFDYKQDPQWIPPSAQESNLLGAMGGQLGPSSEYLSALQQAQGAYAGPGGFSTLAQAGFIPTRGQVGQYLGGAGRAADAFQTSALRNLRRGATEGFNTLRGQQGAAGGLGSTIAGVSEADLMGRALGQMGDIQAQSAGIREAGLQNRMGNVLGGLGTMGSLAQQERAQNLAASQGMMQSAQGQQGMDWGQSQQMLENLRGYRQEPYLAHLNQWALNAGFPKPPSGIDTFLGLLAGLGG